MTEEADNIISILKILEQNLKDIKAPLKDFEKVQTQDPYRILVATILSSRTKDEVTTVAAERFFTKASNLHELAQLSTAEIEELIYPVGFYRNKARFLAQLPAALARFDGRVPDNLEDLLKLPGVGIKTANLVLARAFGKPAICVDTHVHRIMNKLLLVDTETPEETMKALEGRLPQNWWSRVNPLLVSFGQTICRPAAPRCSICPIEKWCPDQALGKDPKVTQKP